MPKRRGKKHTLWWPSGWIMLFIQLITLIVFILNVFQTQLNDPLNFLIGLPSLFAGISFVLDFFGIKKQKIS